MKLYYFNPNNWGNLYFVMAEDKIKAHEYLLIHFQNKIDMNIKNGYLYNDIEIREMNLWKAINPLDEKTFHDNYSLDEFNVGDVLEAENC